MPTPTVPLIVAAATGAAVIARWVLREYRRINAELDAVKRERTPEPVDRSRLPTLRRDPQTGEYRPQ